MKKHKDIKIASILGICSNLFLLVIKSIAGIITKSQAMIADAINSASDIFSSIMTLIGNKISSAPRDADHNLGHGKAEYIYSMLISIVMFLLCFVTFKDSLLVIIFKKKFNYSHALIITCIITIIIKLSLYFYTNKLSKKYHNILIKANSKDHLNDSILTTLNLVSCILASHNIYLVDGYVGVIIAIWIFISAVKIFKESYNVLMDKSIPSETRQKVLDIVKNHPEIKKTNHFNSTPIGYKYQISLTIFVDGNLSTYESHTIADNLEKEILKNISEIYLAVIHVNPIDINEEEKCKK